MRLTLYCSLFKIGLLFLDPEVNDMSPNTVSQVSTPSCSSSDNDLSGCRDSACLKDSTETVAEDVVTEAQNEEASIEEEEGEGENGDDNVIRVKLKYLNDDLKLVDGKLEELLGEFKR